MSAVAKDASTGTEDDLVFSRGHSGDPDANWIVCQLGAREHYSIARTLHASDHLKALVTDIWIPSRGLSNLFPPRLRGRFHPDLRRAVVLAPTIRSIAAEAMRRPWRGRRDEELLESNRLFQLRVLTLLRRIETDSDCTVLFSYSYAAKRLFRYAKERGWKTVLGQIDPGPKEERIVAELVEGARLSSEYWRPASPAYWREWRDETELADRIIVNSEWSRDALLGEGIPSSKIRVIPLSYGGESAQQKFHRNYPQSFGPERPLRVLFLGQINLRKGAQVVFDVCRAMVHLPVEFWFAGAEQIPRPIDLQAAPNIRWIGSIRRHEVHKYYQMADVFLFPTFSDGFGLTQLEAQSWRLPVVSSRACGEVVMDGVNGKLLDEQSPLAILEALRGFLAEPSSLQRMSDRSGVGMRFTQSEVNSQLIELEQELVAEMDRERLATRASRGINRTNARGTE